MTTTPQPQPSAETRARELVEEIPCSACINGDVLSDDLTYTVCCKVCAGTAKVLVVKDFNELANIITERDSFKAKAEALDWYENHHGELMFVPGQGWCKWHAGARGLSKGHWVFMGADIFSAIATARKDGK